MPKIIYFNVEHLVLKMWRNTAVKKLLKTYLNDVKVRWLTQHHKLHFYFQNWKLLEPPPKNKKCLMKNCAK